MLGWFSASDRPSLTLKAFAEPLSRDFDCDIAPEPWITRAINLAHAAGADGARASKGPKRVPVDRDMMTQNLPYLRSVKT